jgi:hypothetical protein
MNIRMITNMNTVIPMAILITLTSMGMSTAMAICMSTNTAMTILGQVMAIIMIIPGNMTSIITSTPDMTKKATIITTKNSRFLGGDNRRPRVFLPDFWFPS